MENSHKDFFISYVDTDRKWAEWIAWQLEEAGYSTMLQAWDIRPGSNFVLEIDKATQKAERTIAVLSPEYLNGSYTQAEWAAAFRRDPTGEQGLLLPIHVRECKHQLMGLLGSIAYIDLVGFDDMSAACEVLLSGIRRERAKPVASPSFPAGTQHSLPEQPRFPGAFPHAWTVPYQRNPFFTGREEVLKDLYDALRVGKTVAVVQPRALTGLGGIGKTQTAVEFAYRYYSDYPEAILWARADSREGLAVDFVAMAHALHLAEEEAQDQNLVIDAVKRWLKEHANWLLILDNVEDLAMIKTVLPSAYRGHVLLTTRMQATGGMARSVEMEQMESAEGTLLLLRRASLLAPDALLNAASKTDKAQAQAISQVMDGLPLALDQAGAYIEETGCSLSDYLEFFEQQRAKLLKRRGPPSSDHPESVATTWSLSFEKVERANPAAAELLRFCAFLHPDAIPEEVITEGAPALGPILQPIAADLPELSEAIGILLRFSLVRRNRGTKLLSIHRLVQAVLKDDMDDELQHLWAERTVKAVNLTFPKVNYTHWLTIATRCQRCLAQALVCAMLIEQKQMKNAEVAALLDRTGYYLDICGYSREAEQLLQRALALYEQVLGPEHPDVAHCLNTLGLLHKGQAQYVEAENFYRRALAIWEKILGPNHPDVATCLSNIAFNYIDQEKYTEAEEFCLRSLSIREHILGSQHPEVAYSLIALADIYRGRGKYAEAEPLYLRALSIREQTLGPDHPSVAYSFSTLGKLYQRLGKYAEAEPLYLRALSIRERVLVPTDPSLLVNLTALGSLYHDQRRYAEAEPLYLRALSIREQTLGPDHLHLAKDLSNLGLLYHQHRKYAEAELLYLRALSIIEKNNHLQTVNAAIYFNNLAKLYYDQGRYAEADSHYLRALTILEQFPQLRDPVVGQIRGNVAKLYHDQRRYAEAESLYVNALPMWELQQQKDRRWVTFMKNIAGFYDEQGRYAEAEPLYQQVIAVCEQALGPDDPDVANILESYASLLRKTKREAEAVGYEARVKAIYARIQE